MKKMTLASCFVLMVAVCLNSAESWHFLPNFQCDVRGVEKFSKIDADVFGRLPPAAEKLLAADSPLTDSQRNELRWRPASFPHRDFVNLMPERDVYGWYGCLFDIPNEFQGMDVIADLGIIDDTDAAFINGSRFGGVGQIGVPHGTAWKMDRLYRMPCTVLSPSSNYLAVHVWSRWGLGGIVGPPVLKAAITPPDAPWEVAFITNSAAQRDIFNHAMTSNLALEAASGGEALEWTKAPMPWQFFAGWQENVHFAVFKLNFDMFLEDGTVRLPSSPVVMDMGPVFDVAAFYLNGRRIGLTGRFPEGGAPAFTEAAERGQFIVNPSDWSPDGHNELVAVVYRERGIGGLPGVPGILLSDPLENHADQAFLERASLFTICLQSEKTAAAGLVLEHAEPESDTDRAWLLSHRAHLAFLKWLDSGRKDNALLDDVLAPVKEILTNYPVEAPKQSAMQAFCRILRLAEKDSNIMECVHRYFPYFFSDGLSFYPDRLTQGDWARAYGNAIWAFGAMGQKQDVYNRSSPPLGYHLSVPGKRDVPRMWLPQRQFNLSERSALSLPDGQEFLRSMSSIMDMELFSLTSGNFPLEKGRAACWWDDHGEMHPFDDEGPDLILELPDTNTITGIMPVRMKQAPPSPPFFTITLHHLDFDWRCTLHPRQQSVIMTDMNGNLLDAVWLGKTDTGVYQTFHARRDRPVRFRSVKHRSACVALSSFFADVPPKLPPRPDTLPDCDLHPVALVQKIPEKLRMPAEKLLAAQPGPQRIAAARAYLSAEDGACGDSSAVPRAVFLAFAADAAFDFEARLPLFTQLLDTMRPEDLRMLLHYLAAARCHKRWLFIGGMRLLESVRELPRQQARRLLRVFDTLGLDSCLRRLGDAACRIR